MRRRTPYLLLFPGMLWLAIFFVVPLAAMLALSLQTGNIIDGFEQTWNVGIFAEGIGQYGRPLVRSLIYGGIATVLMLLIGYPVAYWIAFRAAPARRNVYLFLLLLPFFVSFVLRTISWQFFLADEGVVLGTMKSAGLLPAGFSVLAGAGAVIGGLTYNWIPFMILPIYVALERIDPRVVEAASDLYASRFSALLRVVFPLSVPGVFAGILMTFVPASSDYVNAAVLGGPGNTMIGNIIYTEYFTNSDYPMASALSAMMMGALLIGIFAYARALGTRDVFEAAAR